MKRCIVLLALLLSLLCLPALADIAIKPRPEDFPRDEAVRIATEQFLSICGYEEGALADFSLEADLWEAYDSKKSSDPHRWQVIFAYKNNTELALIVNIGSPSGTVFSAEPPGLPTQIDAYKKEAAESAAAIEAGKTWLAEKGAWELWSYQDKAAFSAAYGRDPYSGAPGPEMGLPGAADVPLDEALAAAKAVIVREFGETDTRLDKLLLDCAFFPRWLTSGGEISRMWVIALRDPEQQKDGMYKYLYQANVRASDGEVDKIVQQDLKAEASGEPGMKSWPPEPGPTASPLVVTGDIYYNPNGGKYYHTDASCPTVAEKYLPLTRIDKSKIDDSPFYYLRPCPYCIGRGQK